MFKSFGMQIAREGLGHAGYVDHWLNVHAPMSRDVHDLMGYVANEVVLAGSALSVPRLDQNFGGQLDGIAQLHFHTEDGLRHMAERPEVARWFEDGPNFVGLRTGFVAEEEVILRPDRQGRKYKAIAFLAAVADVPAGIRSVAGRFPSGLVLSRLGSPTGSTNLPGLEVPAMDYAVELWGSDVAGATARLDALVPAIAPFARLAAAVIVHEHVIKLPEGH